MSYKDLDWIDKPKHEHKWKPRYAGPLARGIAMSIDIAIIYIIVYIIMQLPDEILAVPQGYVVVVADFLRLKPFISGVPQDQLLTFVLYVLIGAVYFTLLTASRIQGTLGKWMIGLHVCTYDGYRISKRTSFFRFISYFLFGWGALLAFLSEEKMAIHDRVWGTLVFWGHPHPRTPERLREYRLKMKIGGLEANQAKGQFSYQAKKENW